MSEPLFTPTTARDLHRNLIEWLGSVQAQQWGSERYQWHMERHEDTAAMDPESEQRRLKAAETFLVTDEMSAVCRHAAMSLPSLAVEHAMLPAEIGFMLFNDRLADHDPTIGTLLPMDAVSWWPAAYGGRAGVAVGTYIAPDSWQAARGQSLPLGMPLLPALRTFLPYGEEPPVEAIPDREVRYAVRMTVTAWLLMAQPITQREHPRIYRPAAKRAARAGLLSDLTVVMLRQPKAAPSDEPSGREYHRRWIVRGHWRRIPTPEQPARVTWVHGYVKGPADQPLVMTDRVTVLAR